MSEAQIFHFKSKKYTNLFGKSKKYGTIIIKREINTNIDVDDASVDQPKRLFSNVNVNDIFHVKITINGANTISIENPQAHVNMVLGDRIVFNVFPNNTDVNVKFSLNTNSFLGEYSWNDDYGTIIGKKA